MMVLIKGIGANLANISGVTFHFDELTVEHPLCTKSELAYTIVQRATWQAAAQLGKLLGHSEMLGNPMGMIHQVGSGVAGAVRGVGRGIVRGDGDQIVRGGKQLMGSVVGGAAGLGARLTGSLHSIIEKLTRAIHHALQESEAGGASATSAGGGGGAAAARPPAAAARPLVGRAAPSRAAVAVLSSTCGVASTCPSRMPSRRRARRRSRGCARRSWACCFGRCRAPTAARRSRRARSASRAASPTARSTLCCCRSAPPSGRAPSSSTPSSRTRAASTSS